MNSKAATVSPFVQRTVGCLAAALRDGRFRPDRPLPPHRQWARRLKVSSFTVSRAFRILADQGVVESREGSYTFLRRRPGPDEKPEDPAARREAGAARATLWLPEFQDLRRVRQAEVRRDFQQAFQQRHPRIQIQEELRRPPPDGMTPLLFQHLLQGKGPTLCEVKRTDLAFLVKNHLLAPFPAVESARPSGPARPVGAAGSEIEWREYRRRIRPEYLRSGPDTPQGRNGRPAPCWLLPVHVSFSFLFYNQTLFRAAGLDPARPPRDWEEFEYAAQRLCQAAGGEPVFHLFGWDTAVWFLMQLAYETMPLGEDGDLPGIDWLSPAVTPALARFQRWLHEKKWLRVHTGDHTDFLSAVLNNRVAMTLGSSAIPTVMARGAAARFGIAPMPRGANGRTINQMNTCGWALNAQARPEDRAAAMRYLIEWESWLHSRAGATRMIEAGVWPGVTTLFARPEEDHYRLRDIPAEWFESLEALRRIGRCEPAGADWNKMIFARTLAAPPEPGRNRAVDELRQDLILSEQEYGLNASALLGS